MVQGNWVGDLHSVSFFCFPFCSSSPMSTSIAQDGVGGFTLCALIPFLLFTLLTSLSFFSLSLAMMSGDPELAGFMYLNNNNDNNDDDNNNKLKT